MRKDRLTTANVNRKQIQDFDVTSALDRYLADKSGVSGDLKFGEPRKPNNQFAENIGVSTNDEVGGLLKDAINKLKTDPNDLNAQFALKGMGLLYEWENLNILDEEVGKEKTYYNFEAGKLNDQNELEKSEQPPKQPPIQDITPSKEITPVSEAYDRTDPTQRRDRRLQDKLVQGSPLDRFKLNQRREEEKIKIREPK
jgi:hypothetical protein